MLGICRGAQVLNIARGGNLYQHLPDQVGALVVHRQPGPIARPTHTVRMAEGSMLRRVMGRAWAWENSLHHQAVARVGAGLRPVAWALTARSRRSRATATAPGSRSGSNGTSRRC